MPSTDCSAPYILPTAVKFGTGVPLLLRDWILEFYFINILFCKDLGGGVIWTNTGFQVHRSSPLTSTFGLFLSFFTPLATLTHVFYILRAALCAVHGNKCEYR